MTALQPYSSAVATIQIREIPEDVYEILRARARASGRSIQSYMRDVVIDFAARPTADEVFAVMANAPGVTCAVELV